MRKIRIVLIIVAVACFGVALSYPIRYRMAQESNNADMEQLAAMRQQAAQQAGVQIAISPGGSSEAQHGTGTVNSDETEGQPSQGDAQQPEAGTSQAPAGLEDAAPQGEADEEQPQVQSTAAPEESSEMPDETGTVNSDETEGQPSQGNAQQPETGTSQTPAGSEDAAPQGEADGEQPQDTVPPGGSEGTPTEEVPEGTGGPTQQQTPAATDAAAPQGEADGEQPQDTVPPEAMDLVPDEVQTSSPESSVTPEPTPSPEPTPTPSPTPDRHVHNNALPYPMLDRVELDESAILPELREIYELNRDLIGWLVIPDTVVDYPVVQTENSEFYLEHDFFGNANINGQIILDPQCDPYTPSYNLIISGHHMKNGSMFGNLPDYRTKSYWERHRFLEFDSLMFRKQYVVFAAFYSADYDEDEEGFRYNADIRYALEAEKWLEEVRENQLYDTEIDVEFGDEFLTLTTCNRARHRNGRFVVVCRRIREGETFE